MVSPVARRITILAVAGTADLRARLDRELGEVDALEVVPDTDGALERLGSGDPVNVVVLPEPLPASEAAVAFARRVHQVAPALPVVVVSSTPESRDLFAAIQTLEVTLAVQQDWRPGELSAACMRAYEIGRLRAEAETMRTQMHRRLDSLAALHEVSAAIADVDSYEEMARQLSTQLARVLRFDISATTLLPGDATAPVLSLHCHEPCSEHLVQAIRDRCLELMRSLSTRPFDEGKLAVTVTGKPLVDDPVSEAGSESHAMIKIGDSPRGFVLIASSEPNAFQSDDDRLLYYLVNRAAAALERLSRRIHDQRQRLTEMVESMADGLILTDLTSEEVLINPAARRMLDIYADVPITKKFLKEKLGFYPFDLVITRAGTNPAPLREEVKVGDRLLHSMVSPVRDARGKLSGVVVVLRDMTEANELARRQNEFVSVVSHELRTPLTSITGSLDIVLGVYSAHLSEKQRRYLQMARESCTRLNLIVDDLLDVARSESGRMPINFTPLMLDELAQEVVERYRPAAQRKQIDVQVTTDAGKIRIVGDPDRLTQVLNNLLSNAIKFTPEGGRIEVEIFGPSVASNHVGISVYNNGEPIPEADQERIFDKFEQLQASSTRRVGGTGLGLAISRAIIEAHRGRIWVESRADGTKFVFTLPAAPSEESSDAVPVAITDSTTAPIETGVKVLIALGDLRSTYILKGILMAAGHQVTVAVETESALAEARSERPRLAVIDGSVTPSDALALIEIIKHDPETRRTAVMAIAIPPALRDKALAVGADQLVDTPVEPSAFREDCSRLIAEAGRVSAPRVMVVDDDPAIRAICHDVLSTAGYAVREVADGAQALSEARRFRPELFVLDVMMPDMDGFTAAEQLRADPTCSLTPIIFLSAKGETADKVRAFRIGAEDYIVKPFDAAELVARVAKALERRQRELGASPTTLLPGADAIEAEIERRLKNRGGQHAFCYLDLDNLKAFNDYYGYAKADAVIRQTGDLIRDIVTREGNPSDFIGHIAGDDFVFITSADRVDHVCTTICAAFGRLVPLYYNRVDRERGYIETKDRYGVMRKFPIMGVSLSVVTELSSIGSFAELASAAAAGKELAKAAVGSAYVRDGHLVVGQLSEADDSVVA